MIEIRDTVIIDWIKITNNNLQYFGKLNKENFRNSIFAKVIRIDEDYITICYLPSPYNSNKHHVKDLTIWSKH